MKYQLLGKSGLKVSELCLGTMTFGSSFFNIAKVDQAEANRMVAHSWDRGVNFFDTADVYSYGESEEILGRAIRDSGIKREAAIVATKVRSQMTPEPDGGPNDVNNTGLSRHHIMAACEASLRRLGTDYIDLYQVHGWDIHAPLEETMRALDDLVRSGKVRYIGCSNWSARKLAKSLMLSEMQGWERFVSLQAYYSLVARDIEHELRPLSLDEGLGLMVWSPLSGGFLSGKYKRDDPAPDGARRTSFGFPPIDEERGFDAVDALVRIATQRDATPSQVAIRWLLSQPGVTSVIIGANKMSQLEDNIDSANLALSSDDVEKLSATTIPRKQYPQWMIERQNEGR